MSDTSRTGPSPRGRTRTKVLALGTAAVTASSLALASWSGVSAAAAPVGQGFNLNASDLRFVLKQIKIAEQHADTLTAANPCGTMQGAGADQIPAGEVGETLPWGLRLIDGTCNNLVAGKVTVGAADQDFPRLVPKSLQPAEDGTTYASNGVTVRDSQPRVISNLIVDQTADNPAAVDAAGEVPETTPSGAFFIPNVAPDVGLSAPYNSWFTLFGQFFDHGLDLVNKGGNGTVFMPLKTDDPLYVPNAPTNFMVLTRATHDGNHEANNQTSPWVDQSQTYTSHPSHQVFLRKYDDANPDAAIVALPIRTTGGLLTGPGGGMATWADVKTQARTMLGIALTDANAMSIPLLATDPYGRYLRGPARGLPQLVVPGAPGGLVEGNLTTPVSTAGATPTGHAFLDDIAHNAVPKAGSTPDPDSVVTPNLVVCEAPGFPTGCVNQYDNEMLDAHFIAGDGRVNENIGLTSVHHVFHSEHNRLVQDIQQKIQGTDAARTGALLTAAEEADWKASRYTARDGSYDYGERLFQAARFVTEMEYQHLAFEEFIRKVQPLVNPFGEGGTGYNTAINPAIKAEFAHAVYRFGHSMLTESVDRVRANGTRDDIPLLTAFLNPPSFMAGGRTPEQAAGDVVRGMTRQVGNELDEFVTEALRNQLLGLPLDLAALNMARARDTGTPSLNAARRSFYAASGNSSLAPYQSWADFSFSIKHAKSLNNFIAAYGTHPSIIAATTTVAKRAAADALVYGEAGPDGVLTNVPNAPDPEVDETQDNIPAASVPADRYAFLNSAPHQVTNPTTGVTTTVHTNWVDPGNTTNTGVDRIDLWTGGLAEKQHVFGGLLGPTFNYVFESQMEDLQFGDRFYYLSRTAGLNMLTQLEGNSFAELIQRNTDVSGLPADSFSRPAFTFDLANLGTTGAVLDDPATPYNESTLLTRMPDGTIRYGGPEHVVFNGTSGNNRVWSSEGDDTYRGNDGNDWFQGGDGNDNHIGGLGDDILLDSNGDDTIKGGDGNDTLSSGQGFGGDLLQGGRDNDVIVHGNDLAESFGGPGNDWVLGGAGDDTVFGDDGDDWIESGATVTGTGGGAFNLLQGDNGAPFQDDPNEAGHDVLIGYGGETDNDAEGGDDVMLNGPGIQRNEGMLGFDYATHDGDLAAADSDMALTGLLPPSVETNKDRFDFVETLSGWNLNDTLRGDDRDAAAMVGHELTAAGSARVTGLSAVLGGATTFTGGNILMGGAGSDLIEGRGGNDVIDGDSQLNVRISVRSGVTEPTTQIDSVETLAAVTPRVIAGTINPGQLRIVREIQTPANGTAIDTAIFTGPRAEYDVTFGAAATTVVHARGTAVDGTDTLRRVERLRFSDGDIAVPAPATLAAAPTAVTATAGNAQATVAWTAPTDNGGSPITGYQVRVAVGTTLVRLVNLTGTATSTTVTGLTNGTAYNFRIRAVTAVGLGAVSAPSNTITPIAPTNLPTAPGTPVATVGNLSAGLTWTAPTNDGGSPITGYQVRVSTGTTLVRLVNLTGTATSTTVTGLTNGTAYNFRIRAVTAVGLGAVSAPSNTITAIGVPSAPGSVTATAGNASATVNWAAPTFTGGSPITQYRIQVRSGGVVLRTVVGIAATARTAVVTGLTNGTAYDFRVAAVNAAGVGTLSTPSSVVTPATVPGAPVIGTAVSGVVGGAITATANWAAPAANGGSVITGYRVFALRLGATGTVLATTTSAVQPATARTLSMTLVAGNYRFQVTAINARGESVRSAQSNQVVAR
ncbi:peroxidase family protein [Knoellia sp. S7-12]|uniref:peroxidase family protein n=1 Tax=Knoellia sp. S7-12 TaxID=3126698 RepID=UPI0033699845